MSKHVVCFALLLFACSGTKPGNNGSGGSGGTGSGGSGGSGSGGSGGAGGAGSSGGSGGASGGNGDMSGTVMTSTDLAGGTTVTKVYITWYGFNDNSCQVESQHDCNTIAYPKNGGFPTVHDIATEGMGTYADPNTFATGAMDSGTPAEIAVGHRIYVPFVRKYFVMEDQCAECGTEWFTPAQGSPMTSWHVDLWMGPSFGSDTNDLNNCEDNLTQGDTYKGTGTIVVDPPDGLPVDTNPLFTNNSCTAHTY